MTKPGRAMLAGASWLAASQVIRVLGRMGLLVAVLRYFGPTNKGIIDIALAAYAIGSITQLQTGQVVQTFIPRELAVGRGWSVNVLLWQTYGMTVASQIVLSLVTFLASGTIARFYDQPALADMLRILAIGNLIVVLRSPIDRSALIAFQKYSRAATYDVLQLAGEAAGIAWVIAEQRAPEDYVLALALAPLPPFIYGWMQYRRLRPTQRDKQPDEPSARAWFGKALRFGSVVSVGSATNAVYLRMGALVLGKFAPPAAVAIYSLAQTIVLLPWSVASTSESVLLPSMSQASSTGLQDSAAILERGWRAMMAYAAVVSAGLVAFSRETVWLAGGSEFLAAAPLLAILAFLPLVTAVDSVRMVFYITHRPKVTVIVFGAVVAAELLTSIPILIDYGVTGMAVARVAWRTVFALIISLLALRVLYASRFPDAFTSMWVLVVSALLVIGAAYLLVGVLDANTAMLYPWAIAGKAALWCTAAVFIVWRCGFLTRDAVHAILGLLRPVRASARPS